jgi:AcrR family transcriptional regulator
MTDYVDGRWGSPAIRRRGDRHRQAIIQAMFDMIQEHPFADLSVRTISQRAGVARSGFYFYFESKYSVLAAVLSEATEELEELTRHFAPRGPTESPEEFARRMIGSAAIVYSHNDPVMTACNAARHQDAEIYMIVERLFQVVYRAVFALVEAEVTAGAAKPISDDLPVLVRTLLATSALVLTGDPFVVGDAQDVEPRIEVLVQMWVNAFWGCVPK